jgi:uridine kinase
MEKRPIFVGIAGGTASGKTSVCDIVFEKIGVKECTLLPMDCFYVELTDEEYEEVGSYNFDHPNAMDWPLIRETFGKLLSG